MYTTKINKMNVFFCRQTYTVVSQNLKYNFSFKKR